MDTGMRVDFDILDSTDSATVRERFVRALLAYVNAYVEKEILTCGCPLHVRQSGTDYRIVLDCSCEGPDFGAY